jgi:hypothetical protein
MSRPKVWRSMWQATGRLAEKMGLITMGGSAQPEVLRPATRCPACLQKLRYSPQNAGTPAQCPRCKERFSLPKRPRPVFPVHQARVGYSALRERL